LRETFRIIWAEAAVQDFESILEYIAFHDCYEAAATVHEKLLGRIDTLVHTPMRCRYVPELKEIGLTEYRELIVRPYRICFRIHGHDVVLVSILDGRRDLEQILMDRAMQR